MDKPLIGALSRAIPLSISLSIWATMARTPDNEARVTGTAANHRETSHQSFGQRLQSLLIDRGWNQSDLARAAFGTVMPSKGQRIAKGRENISQYIADQTVPSARSLHKMATGLGIAQEELMPESKCKGIESNPGPEIEFKVSAPHSDRGLLRVHSEVSLDQFARIVGILKEAGS